jgi:hypothetical protein
VGGLGYYPRWQAILTSNGISNPVVCYEGGLQSWRPIFLSTYVSLGISEASTVTLNIGSSPAVSWTGHGLQNGALVGLTTSGALPTGVSVWNGTAAGQQYFVVNATANSFDLSKTLGGSVITLTGTQSGTQTATSSIYSGPSGRIGALLAAYKNSAACATLVSDQFTQFMGTGLLPNSLAPSWFIFDGPDVQWSMFPVNVIVGSPYQTLSGVAAWNAS